MKPFSLKTIFVNNSLNPNVSVGLFLYSIHDFIKKIQTDAMLLHQSIKFKWSHTVFAKLKIYHLKMFTIARLFLSYSQNIVKIFQYIMCTKCGEKITANHVENLKNSCKLFRCLYIYIHLKIDMQENLNGFIFVLQSRSNK